MLKTKLFVSCCISEEKPAVNDETKIELLPKKTSPFDWRRSNAWIVANHQKCSGYLSLLGFPIVCGVYGCNIFKLMILSHGGKTGALYWEIDF